MTTRVFIIFIFTIIYLTNCNSKVVEKSKNTEAAIVRGQVVDSTGRGFIEFAEIKLLKTDTAILSGHNGYFKIKMTKTLSDTLVVFHPIYGSKKQFISLKDKEVIDIKIVLPISCGLVSKTKTCPKCNTDKNTVTIIYGKPTKELSDQADKGEVVLGGCIVNPCSPTYYCKQDNLQY